MARGIHGEEQEGEVFRAHSSSDLKFSFRLKGDYKQLKKKLNHVGNFRQTIRHVRPHLSIKNKCKDYGGLILRRMVKARW